MFNVLLLENTIPNTINSCFYIKGEKLIGTTSEVVRIICRSKKISSFRLSQIITNKLGCEKSTIPKILKKKIHFPIYLINILLKILSVNKCNFYKTRIENEIEFFKFGTSTAWNKFPKKLTAELAWLCGAVAADGWVCKESNGKERLGIVDQNKCALEIARKNFEEIFGLKLNIVRSKSANCWLLIIDSKAVVRFFTTFLSFNYGKKAETISEPEVVKSSKYRFEFAKGVMAFDGSVELDCTVSIGLKSKKLIQELHEIFNENDLEFKHRTGKICYFLRSPYLTFCKDKQKWISIFGLNTTKGNRLDFLINGSKTSPTSEKSALLSLEIFVRKNHLSKASIREVFNFAKNKQKFTKHDLIKNFNIGHATSWKYLLILKRSGILRSDSKKGPGVLNYYYFNPNIIEWSIPHIIF